MKQPYGGGGGHEPSSLKSVLAELIARRGFARVQAGNELSEIWRKVAGDVIAAESRVGKISRGQLQIAVSNSALLSELNSFRKSEFLTRLQSEHPELKLRDLKFLLRGDLEPRSKKS